MNYEVADLPTQPASTDGAVAVVLYAHDELFNTAVCAWGIRWNTRVACWLASGKPYGIAVVRSDGDSYEKLFLADDDASFDAAVCGALKHLGEVRCRWRIPHMLRSWVLAHVREHRERANSARAVA